MGSHNAKRVVLFGDSIIGSVAPLFQRRISGLDTGIPYEIIDGGKAGDTSMSGLERIQAILDLKPSVVVLGFGLNDWRQGHELLKFAENLKRMINRLQQEGIRVLLSTVTPYRHRTPGWKEFNDAIRQTANSQRIKLADIAALWLRELRPVQKGFTRRKTLNSRGHGIIIRALLNVVPQEHTVILWQYNGRECLCNYSCPYCYYASADKLNDYFSGTVQQWREAFTGAFGRQTLYFYLAFGEPMLGRQFYDVVEMISQIPNWNLRLTSNLSADLKQLVPSKLSEDGRLFINASFHPTQVEIGSFLEKLEYLRESGINVPVIYVMWPPLLSRFEDDFAEFSRQGFLVHTRRFQGVYRGKRYPQAYSDEERRFIARYSDDGTIKFMLNGLPVQRRYTYSGFHFYIVDSSGNVGYDSNCFEFHSKYRTIVGNLFQDYSLRFPSEPPWYPDGCNQGTVDGVSNYIELGYRQLTGNNVISFAGQGGVEKRSEGLFYKHMKTDFADSPVRAEYFFPPRNLKDTASYLRRYGLRQSVKFAVHFIKTARSRIVG